MKLNARKLAYLRELNTKKGRRQHSAFLATGVRVIREAISANASIEFIGVAKSELSAAGKELLESLKPYALFEVSARDMRKLDASKTSQGLIAAIKMQPSEDESASGQRGPVLALDNLSDPSNVGSIIRSALAFGFRRVLLSEGCVELYSPKVLRSSAGGVFHLELFPDCDLVDELIKLRDLDFQIVGTAGNGSDISTISFDVERLCLIIGSEARGISPEVLALCAEVVKIPMSSSCESLSAPVAAAIAMYEIAGRSRKEAID